MLLFILINILVAGSSLLITGKLIKKSGFIDFILSWATIYLAQIILVELCLGIFNSLSFINMIMAHLLIFSGVLFYFKAVPDTKIFLKPETAFIFANKPLLLTLSIFLSFFATKLYLNLINPPICPDSLQYHLTFPAAWLRSANLENPIVIFGSKPTSAELSALSYYPINAELLFFWLMAPLRNAFLADAGEAPFYIIGIISIFSILRKFSIGRETSLFAGLLWALIPNIFKQLRTASQIDVICAALLLVYLNFLIILYRKPTVKNAVLFGITTGMLTGFKVLNFYWLLALMPLTVYLFFKAGRKISFKKMAAIVLAVLSLVVIFGSYSYIRAFILTGNPFYPVKIAVLGRQIFPGFIDKDTFSRIFVNWKEFSLMQLFFREGLGIQFLTFILPGTFIPLLLYPFVRGKNEDRIKYILLFLAPPVMFLMFLFVIKAYWTRYIFSYLGIGLICAFIFLNNFKWSDKYIWRIGTISVIYTSFSLANRMELVVSVLSSILLFSCLVIFKKRILELIAKPVPFKRKAIFISGVVLAFIFFNFKYNREEFSRYSQPFSKKEIDQTDITLAWKWLNDYTGRGEKKIAYTGRSEIYPLYGTRIKNDVTYISINNRPNLPHFYPDGLYRREKNYNAWKKNLKEAKIDLLFIGLPHEINNESADADDFPIEDKWASQDPQGFKLVFANSKARIYSCIF